jgi:hypothetical protein
MPLLQGNSALETVPAGEAEDIKDVMRILRAMMLRDYPPATRPMLRNQHPKSHGCVRAQFSVEKHVPEAFRHGLFAHSGARFPAWVRYSSSVGKMGTDVGKDAHGMAVKVLEVPAGEGLASQDFLMIDSPAFFIANCAEYLEFARAYACKNLPGFFISLDPVKIRWREAWNTFRAGCELGNPLATHYWSQTAYALGDAQAVKYAAVPRTPGEAPADRTDPNFRREVMHRQLSKTETVFDFKVQLRTDPDHMSVEDATIPWDETKAPYVKVATITIPRQEFDNAAQDQFAENLSFNPWHALPEHRPLGCLNRMRRAVYDEMQAVRHRENGTVEAEPKSEEMGGIRLL